MTRGLATWFGPSERPLLGWIHTPADRTARGGVVLCPPMGRESFAAYVALRVLAERLAESGLVALRFDWSGTGDSAGGPGDADLVDGWCRDVATATAFLRHAGCPDVSLVGMRVGATIAAAAAVSAGPLSSIVLWDACPSGAAFLREQRALHRVSLGPAADESDGSVETPGVVYGPATAAALKALSLADLDPGAVAWTGTPDVLVLARPGRSADKATAALLSRAGVEAGTAVAQDRLLDVRSYQAEVPEQTVAEIVARLSTAFGPGVVPVRVDPVTEAVVAHTPDGAPVTERLVRLGEHSLFGIVTSLEGDDGPWLVCTNVASEHHIGPARLWVELARTLAGAGVRTLRFDRRGVGDSVGGDGAGMRGYSIDAVDDTVEAVAALGIRGADHAIVGLCSGAWVASLAGPRLHSRAVYLLNQGVWRRDSLLMSADELASLDRIVAGGGGGDAVSDAAAQSATAGAERTGTPMPLKARVVAWLKPHLPYLAWRALGRLNKAQVPETVLADLVDAGARVELVFASPEAADFARQRGPEGVARLRRAGRDVVCVELTDSDHGLLHRRGRDEAFARLVTSVVADLGPRRSGAATTGQADAASPAR